jgi:hypothetical protein
LGPEYSCLDPETVLFPDHLIPGAKDFIETVSDRIGIPANKWFGFDELALAVAFSHSVPDATLPLIHWKDAEWIPLFPRT